MSQSQPLVTIFGGSGFVGRYIAFKMAREGWRVRVAVRRPNEALFTKPYGEVGQVQPILANIRDDASVASAVAGADAVVNAVGILTEAGKQKFDAIHADAARRIAKASAGAGVKTLVHLSAIGADAESDSKYYASKGKGEIAVSEEFPGAYILRPSIVFGPEDEFFNRFAALSRLTPVLPITGAGSLFQPVFVEDVADAAKAVILTTPATTLFELGGPDVETFGQLMDRMLEVTYRKRMVINMPRWIASMMGFGFEVGGWLTGGLFTPPLTRDQVKQLQTDNIVSDGVAGLSDLGVSATAMSAELPDYLYSYRPAGQYTQITRSGGDLQG